MNYREWDLALREYARLAQGSKGSKREKYIRLFFDALPRDFSTFFKMTHYSLEKGFEEGFEGNTYYSRHNLNFYKYSSNPWGSFCFELKENCPLEDIPIPSISGKFPDVPRSYIIDIDMLLEIQKIVPEEIIYDKMLSLGVNGFWDADDVGFMSGCISYLVFDNISLAVEVLNEKSDNEIASLWYFIYDGPHPDNHKEQFESVHKDLVRLSPRIAELMKVAYEKLLSQHHCSGH